MKVRVLLYNTKLNKKLRDEKQIRLNIKFGYT